MADTATAGTNGTGVAPAAIQTEDAAGVMSKEEAEAGALKQGEFYFSDANLPFDKFLFMETRKNAEGWVDVKLLSSFKRMRPYTDVLGVEGVAEALRASEELLEVNEEGTRVRRSTELKPPQNDPFGRSIYAKGFGEEYPGIQEDLEKFFAQFGDIAAVRMRREKDKAHAFKGSVFVEFKELDDMKAFLELEPKPKWKDTELLTMSKDAYVDMKMKEKGIDPSNKKRGIGSGPSSMRTFNAFRDVINKPDGGAGGGKYKNAEAGPVEFDYHGKTYVCDADGKVDESQIEYPKGSVLKFSTAGPAGPNWWRELRTVLDKVAVTSFVDLPEGTTKGQVGFKESVTDGQLDKTREEASKVDGIELTWERLGEEEERAFHTERVNFRANKALQQRRDGGARRGGRGGRGGRRGGGRGGGRGGHGGGANKRKREGDEVKDTPASAQSDKRLPPTISKKAKTEGGEA